VSQPPTTLAPTEAPTTPNPTSTPKTCEANGSSCGGEPDSLPCCQGSCTHVHGLGRKCLWIQPPSTSTLPTDSTVDPTPNSPEMRISDDWDLHLFGTDAPVSQAPTTVVPSQAPISATQADSVVASSSKTCEATGSSCGEVDSKPCCPGDRCVHVHGLGRKCLWIHPAPKVTSPAPSTAAPTPVPSTLPPTTVPTSRPTEYKVSNIWSMMQFDGGSRSIQDAHKQIEAFMKTHANKETGI